MSTPTPAAIRQMILGIVERHRPRTPSSSSLQLNTVFTELRSELGGRPSPDVQEIILTEWHELMRTGFFAWGCDLDNSSPPFFHVTDRGRRGLQRVSRDPSNPQGYLRYLESVVTVNAIAQSYVSEGLACYNSGQYKAAAVMLGGSMESLVLELRDDLVAKLTSLALLIPKKLRDWRVKTIQDALKEFFDEKSGSLPRQLREEFESYFMAFAQHIRAGRNEAGHPSSVDPVKEESVHASFLIYPELARLAASLRRWVTHDLQ